jgi:nitronate monooxygenase
VESGGHTGVEEITSLIFIPRIVDSVNIPVIAAGGFYDGRGLVAALALGAEGVIMGTRFMASKECAMHPKMKEKFLQTGVADTVLIERSIKNTARAIKNDLALKVLEMEERRATLDELFPFLTGERIKKAYASGNADDAVVYCGQVVGLIDSIPSVKEIIDGIVRDAERIEQRLHKVIGA